MTVARSLALATLTWLIIGLLNFCINALPINKDEYLEMRQKVLGQEYRMRLGGTINLSDTELEVNAILMKFKAKELEDGRRNATNFPPSMHFVRAKKLIDDSEVFRIIRSVPKGTVSFS